MKRTSLITILVAGLISAFVATAQKNQTATPQTEVSLSPVPSLGLIDAVHVAETYLKENEIDTSKHYLDNVRLQQTSSWMEGKHWIVTWKLKVMTDGGEIFVFVDMNKNVKQTFGE